MSSPSQVGPYRIVRPLGQGGMGVVYLAVHRTTGGIAAVKTLRAPSHALLSSLRREIQALARIDHPGVVRIVDEGVDEGIPWYAMEILEGVTLRSYAEALRGDTAEQSLHGHVPSTDRLDDTVTGDAAAWWTTNASGAHGQRAAPTKPLAALPLVSWVTPAYLESVLRLVVKLCSPLAFVHGEGFVHRDLKPENVLVRRDGSPVVVDFGLSRAGAAREVLDTQSALAGTVAYMSPEQCRAEVPDARADLYALGCILYELLTGSPPFTGKAPIQVIQQHLEATPAPPSSHAEGIPGELDRLVLRLLEKHPARRLGYAQDVARELAAVLGEPPPRFEPAPRPYLYRPGFAGRADILRSLRDRLVALRSGRGGIVLLDGASGIGKTRIATEMAREARAAGLTVLVGECPPPPSGDVATAGRALLALKKPLRTIADRCQELGRVETERLIGPRGALLALYEPSIGALPGVEGSPLPPGREGDRLQARLFRAIRDCLTALAVDAPILLVLDDLQWADSLSLGFLQDLASRQLRDLPLLVLGTYRPEEAPATIATLGAQPEVGVTVLPALDDAAVGCMLGDMLALDALPSGLAAFLARFSDGNPFFLAQYARAAVDEGLFFRDPAGRWQVAEERGDAPLEGAPEDAGLPRSLRDLIARRLLRLSPDALELVEAAAVVGREVPGELLLAVGTLSSGKPDGLLEAIMGLLTSHILEETRPWRFRFAHDKLREITYAGIPSPRRRLLHRLTAEAISRMGRGQEWLVELGHHWELAEVGEKALSCYLEAAPRLHRSGSLAESRRLYRACVKLAPAGSAERRRALECLGDLEAGFGALDEAVRLYEEVLVQTREASPGVRATLRYKVARSRLQQGLLDAADEALRRALADPMGAREAVLLRDLAAHVAFRRGDLAAALLEVHEARRQLRDLDDPKLLGRIHRTTGDIYHARGELAPAARELDEAIACFRRSGEAAGLASALGDRGNLAVDQGRFADALAMQEEALALRRSLADEPGVSMMLGNLSTIHIIRGDLTRAEEMLTEGIAIQERTGDRLRASASRSNLATLAMARGRGEEALAQADQAVALAEHSGDEAIRLSALLTRQQVLVELGRLDDSLRVAREIEAASRGAAPVQCRVASRVWRGAALGVIGADAEAEECLLSALQEAHEHGFVLEGHEALVRLSELELARDRPVPAAKYLDMLRARRVESPVLDEGRIDLLAIEIAARRRRRASLLRPDERLRELVASPVPSIRSRAALFVATGRADAEALPLLRVAHAGALESGYRELRWQAARRLGTVEERMGLPRGRELLCEAAALVRAAAAELEEPLRSIYLSTRGRADVVA